MGIYGASGCGRGILPLVREELAGQTVDLVFVDDSKAPGFINDHRILVWDDFLNRPAVSRSVCIAIADPAQREKLALRCDAAGVRLRGARARSVVEMDSVNIGEGACLSPFVTLTSNISIGRCFHGNLYSYVEHDCVIGDFVTFAPGAKCNGNVVIEDRAYVGSGAVIRQGSPGAPLIIGADAIVGMGAIVTKSVPRGAVVVGNPARSIKHRKSALD